MLDWLAKKGCADESPMYCLPGTHCKWVQLFCGEVKRFSTTFSGKLFFRLNDESSLVKEPPKSALFNKEAFIKGLVARHQAGGLLHHYHLFSVRSQVVCSERGESEA